MRRCYLLELLDPPERFAPDRVPDERELRERELLRELLEREALRPVERDRDLPLVEVPGVTASRSLSKSFSRLLLVFRASLRSALSVSVRSL